MHIQCSHLQLILVALLVLPLPLFSLARDHSPVTSCTGPRVPSMSTMSPIRPSCCPHQSSPEAASPPRSSSSINARTVRKRKSSPLSLHDSTLGIPLFRLARLLALLDLSNHSFESFADILVVARAGLREAAAQLFGELLAVGEGDLALLGAQVGFVAYDCEGDCVGALDGIC